MNISAEYKYKKSIAIDKVRKTLKEAHVKILEEKEINYGRNYNCSCSSNSKFAVKLYFKSEMSSKIVFTNTPDEIIEIFALKADAKKFKKPTKETKVHEYIPTFPGGKRIGTDESGKGDYFGPLVIAGVYIDEDTEKKLEAIHVKDSKDNSDQKNKDLASKIKKILGEDNYDIVCISPQKYNSLYEEMKNLNALLAWGHARAIENILTRIDCGHAIADRFDETGRLNDALMEKGKLIDRHQIEKGERDTAVAAASILARDEFLKQLASLGRKAGFELPKGGTEDVVEKGKRLVKTFTPEKLGIYAKLHWKTTNKVLND